MKNHITSDLGVVVKKNIKQYIVATDGRHIACNLSPRLRQELVYSGKDAFGRHGKRAVHLIEHVDPVAVGDKVEFIPVANDTGQIVAVQQRNNRIARRSAVPMPTAHPFEQVIAANVDQIVPVFAVASPDPTWNLLDRYLVSAESLEVPALICLTKLDLVKADGDQADGELSEIVAAYREIGYRVILTSTISGEGMDEFKAGLQGRISLLVGKSGVGKTSLLNAIQPGLGLKVNAVNLTTGKGRHTTSYVEMFPLNSGGAIIDTPGIREFGLWDLDLDDLAAFFPEMRPFVGQCRFGLSCQHEDEPGCAIRKAVTDGRVSPRRYKSFLHLKAEGYFYDQEY